MSPQQKPRFRSLYLLMALNLVLLALTAYGVHEINTLQNRLAAAEGRNYQACLRGNVLRQASRHALVKLGDPESMRLLLRAELKRQPCEVIYPGGTR